MDTLEKSDNTSELANSSSVTVTDWVQKLVFQGRWWRICTWKVCMMVIRCRHPTHMKRGTVGCIYNCARCSMDRTSGRTSWKPSWEVRILVPSSVLPRLPSHRWNTDGTQRGIGGRYDTHTWREWVHPERVKRLQHHSGIQVRTHPPFSPHWSPSLWSSKQTSTRYCLCTCGKVYIDETTSELETCLKEQKEAKLHRQLCHSWAIQSAGVTRRYCSMLAILWC